MSEWRWEGSKKKGLHVYLTAGDRILFPALFTLQMPAVYNGQGLRHLQGS